MKFKLKFGVFTKWDKNLQDEKEEEKIKTTVKVGKRQQIRDTYKGCFQKFVNDECPVYFVDAKHFSKAKVSYIHIDNNRIRVVALQLSN